MAAAFGVEVGLVQVRAQQREQRAVTLGEVRPGPAEQKQPQGPPGPAGFPGPGGQAQLQLVLQPLGPAQSLYMPVQCHCRAE